MKPSTYFAAISCLVVSFAASAAPATSATASLGLTSTKPSGAVSIQTDPSLSSGRLVMKVAAHNATDKSATLSEADVHIFIGDKVVELLGVDELIAEVRGSSVSPSDRSAHQASDYSRPGTTTNTFGEPDITGITGASSAPERAMDDRSRRKVDPAVEAQVEALRGAILQSLEIGPGKAAGAQVVSEKIKFARKDPHVLRVEVTFNGEAHEFEFEAPPAK